MTPIITSDLPDEALLQRYKRDGSYTDCYRMAEPRQSSTRLYFGSVVVPKSISDDGKASFGFAFHALHGFHHLYTKALMKAAQAKLAN